MPHDIAHTHAQTHNKAILRNTFLAHNYSMKTT